MSRAGGPLIVFTIVAASVASAQTPMGSSQDFGRAMRDAGVGRVRSDCKAEDPKAVVVCGRSGQPYRIDATVLAATRAADAPPPKPPLGGDVSQAVCSGPQCGGGTTIPLVGMALTALKAAELAANGDDWRDALRTHPDQYRVYERTKSDAPKKARIGLGVSAGSK